MGMWTNITVHVETASKEQMDSIRQMDTQNQGWGTEYGFQENVLEWTNSMRSFDSEAFLESISDLLDKQGFAYVIDDCEEDIPVCTTYYYLGDGIKSVTFTVSEGQEAKIDRKKYVGSTSERAYKSVFASLEDWELLGLYIEERFCVISYNDSMDQIADIMAYSIGTLACDCFYLGNLLDELRPELRALIQPLYEKNHWRYEDRDFVPNLAWEHKRIATFSDEERNRLKGITNNDEVKQGSKPLRRSKRLVKDYLSKLVSQEPVTIESKLFVVDGDSQGDLKARIVAAGGIVDNKVKKKTDYLVINNHAENCSGPKLCDYWNMKKKGSKIQLITFDTLEGLI